MGIVEFLRARLAEDEREARVCLDRWIDGHGSRRRWDRQLREVEANRAIIEGHLLVKGADVGIAGTGGVGCQNCHTLSKIHSDAIVEALGPCDTLLALATVYADHPDYDPEWR